MSDGKYFFWLASDFTVAVTADLGSLAHCPVLPCAASWLPNRANERLFIVMSSSMAVQDGTVLSFDTVMVVVVVAVAMFVSHPFLLAL
ncbi:hypothetical protein TYRP_009988 [Tyrophagus putrescentiae]|nr:hypothetical protein TYRP_009988 [Tyrophagus putrescentiae]